MFVSSISVQSQSGVVSLSLILFGNVVIVMEQHIPRPSYKVNLYVQKWSLAKGHSSAPGAEIYWISASAPYEDNLFVQKGTLQRAIERSADVCALDVSLAGLLVMWVPFKGSAGTAELAFQEMIH